MLLFNTTKCVINYYYYSFLPVSICSVWGVQGERTCDFRWGKSTNWNWHRSSIFTLIAPTKREHKHICQKRPSESFVFRRATCIFVCLLFFLFCRHSSCESSLHGTTEAWCNRKCWLMSFQLTRTSTHVCSAHATLDGENYVLLLVEDEAGKKYLTIFWLVFAPKWICHVPIDSLSFLASMPPATGDPINYNPPPSDKNVRECTSSSLICTSSSDSCPGNSRLNGARLATVENQFGRQN